MSHDNEVSNVEWTVRVQFQTQSLDFSHHNIYTGWN